jgi:TRAP-type C4-dicarboxylate transport system permease small subunit
MIVILVIMMTTLLWQVFTRFVIKVPSIWTEEIARYSFLYMVMIGAALGVRNSTHFGMTMLIDKLQGKMREYYHRFFINVILLICSIILLVYGMEFTITYGMTRVSPTFLVPMAWVFAIIPVSAVLMILFAAYNIVFGEREPAPCNDVECETTFIE